jgi:hypothetical protein
MDDYGTYWYIFGMLLLGDWGGANLTDQTGSWKCALGWLTRVKELAIEDITEELLTWLFLILR